MADIANIFNTYHKAMRSWNLKSAIVFPHLGLLLNQWCTSSRFGLPKSSCPFCHLRCHDTIDHLVTCTVFTNLFCSITRIHATPDFGNIAFFINLPEALVQDDALVIFVYVYSVYQCFNSCRNGHALSRRLIVHHLKLAALHCPTAGACIRRLMRHPNSFCMLPPSLCNA